MQIKLDKEYEYAEIDGNQINIDSSASGKSVILLILLQDEVIYELKIAIIDNESSYANGYGTKDQPYLISTPEQWKTFIPRRSICPAPQRATATQRMLR